jgi:hypothetical protein
MARQNLEVQYLAPLRLAIDSESLADVQVFGGFAGDNRFDCGFELMPNQRFQFGDLRIELPDRTIIIEMESAGGLTNLVKYWPLEQRCERPLFLLHIFGQSSAQDYIAHLRLWDFTWMQMASLLEQRPHRRLWARRFVFQKADLSTLRDAELALRTCLRSTVPNVIREVFECAPQ